MNTNELQEQRLDFLLKEFEADADRDGNIEILNKRAAEIAVKTVGKWCEAHSYSLERIIFNVFKDEDKKHYEELLR